MAIDVEQSPFFRQRKLEGGIIVREPLRIDVESYIANYEGRTRLERLATIASTSTYLSLPAIRAAVAEAKQGSDIQLYLHLVNLFHEIAPEDPDSVSDLEWVDAKTKQLKADTDRLEGELKQYKNNMLKESIRMTSIDLGTHYYRAGDFQLSTKSHQRARDYCTTSKHVAELSLPLLLTIIAQNNWMAVNNQIQRLQSSNLKGEDKAKLDPSLSALTGLAYLQTGQYAEAARAFLSTPSTYATTAPEPSAQHSTSPPPLHDATAHIAFQRQVLTPHDVAVYGALTALATMDRATLRARALDSTGPFRTFLELEPQMRKCVALFVGGQYAACLAILARHRPDWLCDVHLQPHVAKLFARVRQECVVLYFEPFSCVTLDEMSATFGAQTAGAERDGEEVVDIETELVDMIQRGVLNARIDLVKGLLVAPTRDPRQALHASTLEMAQHYEHALRLRLLRVSMSQAGLVLRPQKTTQADSGPAGLGNFMNASSAYSPGEIGSQRGTSVGGF